MPREEETENDTAGDGIAARPPLEIASPMTQSITAPFVNMPVAGADPVTGADSVAGMGPVAGAAPIAGSAPVTTAPPSAAQASVPPAPSLRALAIRGSIWTMSGYSVSQVLRLGSNLVLAYLLFPEAFALMGLVGVFMQGLQMFSDVGIGPSILQHKRGDDPKFLNTAWSISVCRGVILWIGSCLLAWPAAMFFDAPELVELLPIAGLAPVIGGFTSTRMATASRHLALHRLVVRELVVQVCTITVMIAWAWVDRSVWALVAGTLTGSVVRLFLSHLSLPGEDNRFMWDKEAASALFRFGRWITLSTAVSFFAATLDRLILGKLLPLEHLGVYTLALSLAMLPMAVGGQLVNAVLFPVLSKIRQTGVSDFEPKFRRGRQVIVRVAGFAILGVALLSPAFFNLLYDDRYRDAGWMAQLVCVSVWFNILRMSGDRMLMAMGDSRAMAIANVCTIVATLSASLVGYRLGGLPGFILALGAGSMAGYCVVALSLLRHRVHILGDDAWFTAVVAAVGVGGFLLIRQAARGVGPGLSLYVEAGLAGVVLCGVGFWVLAHVRRELAPR